MERKTRKPPPRERKINKKKIKDPTTPKRRSLQKKTETNRVLITHGDSIDGFLLFLLGGSLRSRDLFVLFPLSLGVVVFYFPDMATANRSVGIKDTPKERKGNQTDLLFFLIFFFIFHGILLPVTFLISW